MSVLKYLYIFLWLLVIPTIIGGGVGEYLVRIYHNFNGHFLAGIAVCFFSSAVVTWVPMIFLVEDVAFSGKETLLAVTLFLWIAGIIGPLLFGFRQLGLIITVLMVFSAVFTVTKVLSTISHISRRLEHRPEDDN